MRIDSFFFDRIGERVTERARRTLGALSVGGVDTSPKGRGFLCL